MEWKSIKPWILPSFRSAIAAPRPGLYHFPIQRDEMHVRYHLRVESNGRSLLLAAASEGVRLSQSGTLAAWGILHGEDDSEIAVRLHGLVDPSPLIRQVRGLIDELGRPNKRYPVFNMSATAASESTCGLIAPIQADLVLRDWASGRNALQKLWDAGIPHVRFADVGWKTTCDNFGQDAAEEQLQTLVAAIEFAEDLGMITGVRALASQLLFSTASASAPALDRLAQVGLDYIVLPWGVEAASHGWLFGKDDYEALLSAVQRASSWEMTAVLEAALVRESVAVLEAEIDRMLVREISHLEVFAMAYHPADTSPRKDAATTVATGEHTPFEARELRQLASWIEDLADHRWLQTIWLPPVCAKGFDRQDGLRSAIVRGPRAGSEFSIRVEADGNVIPAKGPRASVGNIQQMPWAEIWSASAFADIREGARQRELCSECPRLTVCATDCPADYQGWADESESPPSGFRI